MKREPLEDMQRGKKGGVAGESVLKGPVPLQKRAKKLT